MEKVFKDVSDWFQESDESESNNNSYLMHFKLFISTLNNFKKWLSFLFAFLEQNQYFILSKYNFCYNF